MESYPNFTNSNVKFLRESRNISQGKLADDLEIDQSTLAKWENNTRQITLEWSIKIANYFNVSVGDFISKDLRIKDNLNEKEILFDKSKDILSDDDWATIEIIIKKKIDNYEKNKKNE